jgi:nucleoid DNA-binding protein
MSTAARRHRNPRTGEKVATPARRSVRFALSATLAERLNHLSEDAQP